MTYATNRLDGARIYFEDDGAKAPRSSCLAAFSMASPTCASQTSRGRCRPTSSGRSTSITAASDGATSRTSRPHMPCGDSRPMRWPCLTSSRSGGPISSGCRGVVGWSSGWASTAPERVLSLVVLGQQPYGWLDSPLTRAVTDGLVVSRTRGVVGVVEALEAFWGVSFRTAAEPAGWTTIRRPWERLRRQP